MRSVTQTTLVMYLPFAPGPSHGLKLLAAGEERSGRHSSSSKENSTESESGSIISTLRRLFRCQWLFGKSKTNSSGSSESRRVATTKSTRSLDLDHFGRVKRYVVKQYELKEKKLQGIRKSENVDKSSNRSKSRGPGKVSDLDAYLHEYDAKMKELKQNSPNYVDDLISETLDLRRQGAHQTDNGKIPITEAAKPRSDGTRRFRELNLTPSKDPRVNKKFRDVSTRTGSLTLLADDSEKKCLDGLRLRGADSGANGATFDHYFAVHPDALKWDERKSISVERPRIDETALELPILAELKKQSLDALKGCLLDPYCKFAEGSKPQDKHSTQWIFQIRSPASSHSFCVLRCSDSGEVPMRYMVFQGSVDSYSVKDFANTNYCKPMTIEDLMSFIWDYNKPDNWGDMLFWGLPFEIRWAEVTKKALR